MKVLLVTHLYSLARGLYDGGSFPAIFLRAERREDGIRTFRLIEAEPLQTSFGEDLYQQIFGADAVPESRVIASSQAAMTSGITDDLSSAPGDSKGRGL